MARNKVFPRDYPDEYVCWFKDQAVKYDAGTGYEWGALMSQGHKQTLYNLVENPIVKEYGYSKIYTVFVLSMSLE